MESRTGRIVNKGQRDLQREDEIFVQISNDEEDDTSFDAVVPNGVEADGFVQGSIDAEDLSTGFDLTIATKEIDVDEDPQGDEVADSGGVTPMTEFEVTDAASNAVHGDDLELDLEDVLTTGRTVTNSRERN